VQATITTSDYTTRKEYNETYYCQTKGDTPNSREHLSFPLHESRFKARTDKDSNFGDLDCMDTYLHTAKVKSSESGGTGIQFGSAEGSPDILPTEEFVSVPTCTAYVTPMSWSTMNRQNENFGLLDNSAYILG
jgi:hypothetical protein